MKTTIIIEDAILKKLGSHLELMTLSEFVNLLIKDFLRRADENKKKNKDKKVKNWS